MTIKNRENTSSDVKSIHNHHDLQHTKGHYPFSISRATTASLDRLKDRSSEDELDNAERVELSEIDDNLDATDSNFKTELNYDGYLSLEESDNDAYGSCDDEKAQASIRELTIEDREEPTELGEESAIDPQENKKV